MTDETNGRGPSRTARREFVNHRSRVRVPASAPKSLGKWARLYVSHHFTGELHWLGIADSPAYVREPEGNGMAEWFIRQLKEQVLWCQRFGTVAEAREAIRAFCERFRDEWIVERLGYRTPAEAYAAFNAKRAA